MQLTEIKLVKGEYYQALKDIDEIIDIFEDARAKKYVAHSKKIKAEVLAKMNRFKEAHLIINEALGLAVETQSPFLMWRIRYAMGHIYAENGEQEKANQNYSKAKSLIEETASKLEDCTLAESLLSTPYYLDIVKYS